MAHGAIGDVVFQRRNGRQQSSVRVRVQTNPQSVQQCIQRSVFATVAQAYTVGKTIFDHSFEGARTPAENQARFYKANLAMLRNKLLAGEINSRDIVSATACFAFPQVAQCVPNEYIVSEGSLPWPSDIFYWQPGSPWWLRFNMDYFPTGMTVRSWLDIFPYRSDDLFSFVAFTIRYPAQVVREIPSDAPNVYYDCNKLYKSDFHYYRFHLKDNMQGYYDSEIRHLTLGDLFIIECSVNGASQGILLIDTTWEDGINIRMLTDDSGYDSGSCGLIYSKINGPERSACQMHICRSENPGEPYNFGIAGGYIADAWRYGDTPIATP